MNKYKQDHVFLELRGFDQVNRRLFFTFLKEKLAEKNKNKLSLKFIYSEYNKFSDLYKSTMF